VTTPQLTAKHLHLRCMNRLTDHWWRWEFAVLEAFIFISFTNETEAQPLKFTNRSDPPSRRENRLRLFWRMKRSGGSCRSLGETSLWRDRMASLRRPSVSPRRHRL